MSYHGLTGLEVFEWIEAAAESAALVVRWLY